MKLRGVARGGQRVEVNPKTIPGKFVHFFRGADPIANSRPPRPNENKDLQIVSGFIFWGMAVVGKEGGDELGCIRGRAAAWTMVFGLGFYACQVSGGTSILVFQYTNILVYPSIGIPVYEYIGIPIQFGIWSGPVRSSRVSRYWDASATVHKPYNRKASPQLGMLPLRFL